MVTVKKGLLLAIDGNSLLHRAYHAYPATLTTADGRPVNAVYGFASMLLDVLLKYKPEYVFCAFDTAKPTFRHTEYIGYKASRPKTDNELVGQFELVDEVLHALNIPIFKLEGFEADDILGTVCHFASEDRNSPVSYSYILTGDRDLLQLVNEKVHAILPKGSFKNLQEYTEQQVVESMGVVPARITDLKGLMGDASDSIPGVKGVGPKTASDLINTYGSLEEIYKNLDTIEQKSKKLGENLRNEEEVAFLSKKLATITVEAPITFEYEKARTTDFSMTKALSVFTQFQFKSVIPKLKKLGEVNKEDKKPEILDDIMSNSLPDELKKMVDQVYAFEPDEVGQDGESFLNTLEKNKCPHEEVNLAEMMVGDRIKLIGEYVSKVENNKCNQFVFVYNAEKISIYDISQMNLKLFNCVKIIFFGLFEYINNAKAGVEYSCLNNDEIETIKTILQPHSFVDVSAISYAMAAGKGDYNIEAPLLQFGIEPEKQPERFVQAVFLRIMQEAVKMAEYKPLERVMSLWTEKLAGSYSGKLNIPLVQHDFEDKKAILGTALMHLRGVSISTDLIQKSGQELEKEIVKVEKEIFDDIGFEFNIRSPKQLGDVLFGQLGLPSGKKTKTGYSTDDEVLQNLIPAHPAIEKILQFRQLTKLNSTYVKPFLELAKEYNDTYHPQSDQFTLTPSPSSPPAEKFRIHSQFHPLYTSSGRLSSNNPNLQNLPVKTELGKTIRKFFVPEKGHVIMSFDYSQIDLRVVAHISGDDTMIEAFTSDQDIHRSTAARVFNIDFKDVDDNQRRLAKTVNFGILYGMSAFGLSRAINLPVKEADLFIKSYFASFPKVKEYIDETGEFVKEHGYVVSLLGRRRFIYGGDSSNRIRQQAALREAVNMPIQGGADDIMRLALGEISTLPEVLSGQIRLVLQVHDELVFEVPDEEKLITETAEKFKHIMENVIKLRVPLKVEYTKGYHFE